MTVHLVTFASKDMERSSWLCATSSKQHGVETHTRFNPGNIGSWKEIKQNAYLFNEKRGLGHWAWKPLIIKRELEWLPDSSTLIYSDAGIEFINNVNYIIDRMGHEKPQDDIWLFGNNWEHAHWCKRDVVDEIMPGLFDYEYEFGDRRIWEGFFGKQVQASVIFFRVSDYTRALVAEWLKWCLFEDGRLIDDSPSRAPNHPEFREHRHDQAILTTMAYREGCQLHYWPAVYNKGGSPEFVYEKLPEYAGDDYPVLFSHHRKRDHEWANI
jgi:hypothetical protein